MLADRFGSGPKLGVVMGTVLSANTLGAIVGPSIGGIFYQYTGYVAPFIFCAILACFCFMVISTIVEPTDLSSTRNVDENSILNDDSDNVNQEFSTHSPSFWNLVSNWNIINVCLAVVVVASVLAGMSNLIVLFNFGRFKK